MALSTVAAPEVPVSDREVLVSLRRAIVRSERFAILIAVCNQPVRRDALIRELAAGLPNELRVVQITADTHDMLPVVQSQIEGDALSGVAIVGAELGLTSASTDHPRIAALNLRRGPWRETVPYPVVFWVPEFLLTLLGQYAPDFMNWRRGTFFFLSPDETTQPPRPRIDTGTDEVWRLTGPEREERIARLRELVARSDATGDTGVLLRWLLELAVNLRQAGKLDEALRVCRQLREEAVKQVDESMAAAAQFHEATILHLQGEPEKALRILDSLVLVYDQLGDNRERAITYRKIAEIRRDRGELDQALHILREEVFPTFERLGDVRERANTLAYIADILEIRGELDESLRIRREEELPVFDQLGDVRERANTLGKIADVLWLRGELDEALRICQKDQLPVYERLGDIRERAITLRRIADILQARREFDAALRIRREEELPAYEQIGDLRSRAVTMGRIADILQARGELNEALRIRREEELPVFERLGDPRERAVTLAKIADILQARGELNEALRIRQEEVLPVFRQLGDVRSSAVTMGRIADILQARGELNEALRIRQEEQLPVFERLGDVQSMVTCRSKIAQLLLERGRSEDIRRALEHLTWSQKATQELGLVIPMQIAAVQPPNAETSERVDRKPNGS